MLGAGSSSSESSLVDFLAVLVVVLGLSFTCLDLVVVRRLEATSSLLPSVTELLLSADEPLDSTRSFFVVPLAYSCTCLLFRSKMPNILDSLGDASAHLCNEIGTFTSHRLIIHKCV